MWRLGFFYIQPLSVLRIRNNMGNKDSIFSFHMLGVEMNIINLSPNSLIDFFVWIVVLYALVRLINFIFKVLEKYLNL